MAAGGSTRNDDEELCGPMLQFRGNYWTQYGTQQFLTRIADELVRKGYQRDAKQCREKLEQLKKKYKKASSRKV